jgi:hypothetical protein
MGPQDREKKEKERSLATAAGIVEHGSLDIVDPQSQDEVEIVRRATEVLGIDHVARWMQSKIPSLGNQTPYVLLQTRDGREQVERVLLKIEHGVY